MPGQFVLGQAFQVIVKFLDAAVAKTAPLPNPPGGAQVVVNMHAGGAGFDGVGHALREVLAEEGLAGAAPPIGHAFVLVIGQPGNFERLALDVAAEALFVGLWKAFVVAAELGDHPDAAEELEVFGFLQ